MLIMASISKDQDKNKDKDKKKLPTRQAALKTLVDNGLTIKQAAEELGYKYSSARAILSHKGLTKSSDISKYSFTGDKKSQRKAYNLINSFASGKLPVDSDIKDLKCSTALGASKYISDHNDPIAKGPEESGNQVNNYTQIININEYRVDNSVKTIDNQDDKDKDNKAIELSP